MKPLHWLMAPARWLERAKGRKRLALIALYAVLAVPLLAGLRWSTCLIGLPDVGEPYDTAAFRKVTIPEADDAFTLYDRAAGEVTNACLKGSSESPSRAAALGWSRSAPASRHWVDENRDKALATWRQATERPDAMADPPAEDRNHYQYLDRRDWFSSMALLEGSRLNESGDMAGAWGWYLASYRSGLHIMMRGMPHRFGVGMSIRSKAGHIASRWAFNPKVDAALLRKALADMRACRSLVPDDGYTLRRAYLIACEDIDRRVREYAEADPVGKGTEWYSRVRIPGLGEVGNLDEWSRFRLGREGERSHRLAKLAFAQWIALADAGRLDERPAIRVKLGEDRAYADFFDMAGGAMAPDDLARWCASSIVGREVLGDAWKTFAERRRSERMDRDSVSLVLAEQLFIRERGSPPPSTRVLIGPYLDRMPASLLPATNLMKVPTLDVPDAPAGPVPSLPPWPPRAL